MVMRSMKLWTMVLQVSSMSPSAGLENLRIIIFMTMISRLSDAMMRKGERPTSSTCFMVFHRYPPKVMRTRGILPNRNTST